MKATYAILVIPKQADTVLLECTAKLYLCKDIDARYATMLVFTDKRKALKKAAELRSHFTNCTYTAIKYEVVS